MGKKFTIIFLFLLLIIAKPYIFIDYSADTNTFISTYSLGATCVDNGGKCSGAYECLDDSSHGWVCQVCGSIISTNGHWTYGDPDHPIGSGTKWEPGDSCVICGYTYESSSGGGHECSYDYYCCDNGYECSCGAKDHSSCYTHECSYDYYCCENGYECSCGAKDHYSCHSCSYDYYCCENGYRCSCGDKDHYSCHSCSYDYYCCANGYECSCGAKDHYPCHTHSYSSATCTKPKTCSCGATSGSKLGHNYNGTVTCNGNGTDKVKCTRCSSTTTKTCVHEFTVTVNPNGGKWNNSASSQSFTQLINTTKTIAKPTVPSGYKVTFNGNGGTAESTSLTSTKSFSKWTLSGGGSLSGTTYTFGSSNGTLTANYTNNSITLPDATRTGYVFRGWYTASSGGTKIGDAGASYTPAVAITLYAHWTQEVKAQLVIDGPNPKIITNKGTIEYKIKLNDDYYLLNKNQFKVSPNFTGTITVSDIDSNNQFTVTLVSTEANVDGEYQLVIKQGGVYTPSNILSDEINCTKFIINSSVKGEIRYSIMSPTKGVVVATFVPNYEGLEDLKTISIEGQTGFGYIFDKNGEHTFNVVDSLGNKNTFIAKVDWIISGQGAISINYKVIVGGTIFTNILLKTDKDFKLDESKA